MKEHITHFYPVLCKNCGHTIIEGCGCDFKGKVEYALCTVCKLSNGGEYD